MKTLRPVLSGLLTAVAVILRIVAAGLWLVAFVLIAMSSPHIMLTLGRVSARKFRG